MTTPRSRQIDTERPGYYHITARNVRCSWLCGVDEYTGVNYDHRKIWVREKIKELNESFFIDVGAYAVMNNHLHLVLKNRPDLVRIATDLELATRYLTVYPGSRHEKDVPRIATQEEIEELSLDKKRMEFVRGKMSSISSFMQRLKEFISVKANKEDKCKGHFWENRFGSQLLTDEFEARKAKNRLRYTVSPKGKTMDGRSNELFCFVVFM